MKLRILLLALLVAMMAASFARAEDGATLPAQHLQDARGRDRKSRHPHDGLLRAGPGLHRSRRTGGQLLASREE